jgi:hypothetical protein
VTSRLRSGRGSRLEKLDAMFRGVLSFVLVMIDRRYARTAEFS